MPNTIFLTLEQILVIHEEQIERYGGRHGVRSLVLIESAVFRPQTTFGGKELYESIFDKAAALAHSILLNHAFVDGNKRTAMVSTVTFLELNGYLLEVSQKQLVKFALKVENKKPGLEKTARWLKKHSINLINPGG